MEQKLKITKIGIVGTGKFALFHLHYWKLQKNIKIIGYFSHSDNSLSDLKKYINLDELFENSDVIDIVSKNYINYETLKKTFNYKNKIIFIEKPFLNSLIQIDYIAQKMQSNMNNYISNFYYNEFDNFNKFLNMDIAYKYKKIYINGFYKRNNEYYFKNNKWRQKKLLSGGGVLINQGIHLFDLVNQKFNLDINFCKVKKINYKYDGIEDHIEFMIKYMNTDIYFKFSSNKNNKNREYIILKKNFIFSIFINKNYYGNIFIVLFKFLFNSIFKNSVNKNNNKISLFNFFNRSIKNKHIINNEIFVKKINMTKKIFKIYDLI